MSTAAIVRSLKENDQDFEWYPTTSEIIQAVARDMKSIFSCYEFRHKHCKDNSKGAVLDVGAGDGRILQRLDKVLAGLGMDAVGLYAIEKSTVHLNNMPKDIVVIGTDFMEQTLVDKPMDVVFCNPPYSEYELWASKLIRECNCTLYLVIPTRYADSIEIEQAVKLREASVKVLGKFDFESADRKARAVVNLLRVNYPTKSHAFDAAIEEMFPELQHFDRAPEPHEERSKRACEAIESNGNIIEALVESYDKEIADMINTYRDVAKINPGLLLELGITKASIMDGIYLKIKNMKDMYWRKLFDHFKPITSRLATKQRKQFLDSLGGKAVIDFTESNIFAMLIWITKWANDHFDDQLIELFKRLSEHANVVNYKSNERVWKKGDWRYYDITRDAKREGDFNPTNYKLEYRMVLEHAGGINNSPYSWESVRGLQNRAVEFLKDCITVANNLGFECDDCPTNYEWSSNKQHVFKLKNGKPLIAVRAFKNGNMHVHWDPKVMLAINVEAGRLLGWVRSHEQAAKEMQATPQEAQQIKEIFGSSLRLSSKNLLAIGCSNG